MSGLEFVLATPAAALEVAELLRAALEPAPPRATLEAGPLRAKLTITRRA